MTVLFTFLVKWRSLRSIVFPFKWPIRLVGIVHLNDVYIVARRLSTSRYGGSASLANSVVTALSQITALIEVYAEHRVAIRPNHGLPIHEPDYSHSMVAGGLLEISRVTRLMPLTSLMMRFETRPRSSGDRCAKSAVMASDEVTQRSAITFS